MQLDLLNVRSVDLAITKSLLTPNFRFEKSSFRCSLQLVFVPTRVPPSCPPLRKSGWADPRPWRRRLCYLQFDVATVTMSGTMTLNDHDDYDDERGQHERADDRSCYYERHA